MICGFRILPGIHSKESLFFLLFGRDPQTPLRKLLIPKIRYLGDERGLLDLEAVRYALAPPRKISTSTSIDKGLTKIIHLQDALTSSRLVILST